MCVVVGCVQGSVLGLCGGVCLSRMHLGVCEWHGWLFDVGVFFVCIKTGAMDLCVILCFQFFLIIFL